MGVRCSAGPIALLVAVLALAFGCEAFGTRPGGPSEVARPTGDSDSAAPRDLKAAAGRQLEEITTDLKELGSRVEAKAGEVSADAQALAREIGERVSPSRSE